MSRRAIYIARRLWWPICAIAALILLRGCAYALVNGDRVNSQQAATIEAGIQDLRQLRFKQPVPLVVKTPDEAESMMEADLMRDYTDNQLAADAVAGALTGLYPAGLDLKAASLKLLKSQVAGFYDPHGKEMVLVEGGADLGIWNSAAQFMIQRDVVGEMLLAHELTHALQDQNFDLESSLDKVKDDDDRTLALKSVAEGDATIAGFAYAVGRMDDSTADALTEQSQTAPAGSGSRSAPHARRPQRSAAVPIFRRRPLRRRGLSARWMDGGRRALSQSAAVQPPDSASRALLRQQRADAANRARRLRRNHERLEKSRRRHLRRAAPARDPRAQSRQAVQRSRTRRAMDRRPHDHPAAEPRRERDLDARVQRRADRQPFRRRLRDSARSPARRLDPASHRRALERGAGRDRRGRGLFRDARARDLEREHDRNRRRHRAHSSRPPTHCIQ